MKLEKFKKNNLRNKKILYSIIGVIVLICGVILFKSFAFFDSKYDFNMIKGRIPEFNGGDIQLAFTIDGVKSEGVFPSISSQYVATNVTCQNGVTASWNNTTWSLENVEPNGQKKINCNIEFKTLVKLYDVVKIGDYVSYTPSITSYESFKPSELDLWRVIKKNEDGTVEMISEYISNGTIEFYGASGLSSFDETLRTIAKQYETEGITSNSRYIADTDRDLITAAIGNLKAQTKAQKGTTTYSSYWYGGTTTFGISQYGRKNGCFYVSMDGVIDIDQIYEYYCSPNYCVGTQYYWSDERGVRPIVKLVTDIGSWGIDYEGKNMWFIYSAAKQKG